MPNRAIPQTPLTLLALSLCALWAFACALAPADPTPTLQPTIAPTPTPQPSASLPAPSSAVECVSSTDPNPTLIQPSPTPIVIAVPRPDYPPPSIERRVFDSDAIVRARQPAVSGELRAIPSADAGVAPTCRPVVIFQFPIIEYLKGSGGDELTVEWQFAGVWPKEGRHTYLTREDAQTALEWLPNRDVTLETRDAVIFLQAAQPQQAPASASRATAATYNFTRIYSNDYALHESSRPWLPLADASSNTAAQSDAEPVYLLGSDPAQETARPPTISLAELRASVEAAAALLKAGESIEGYKDCVRRRLTFENESTYDPLGFRPLNTAEISLTCRQ